MKLDQSKTALILGVFVGLMHAVWSVLIALGLAQMWMDWIFSLHFLNNPFNVLSFNLITAITLTVVTFIVGYIMGWVFAYIWNQLISKK